MREPQPTRSSSGSRGIPLHRLAAAILLILAVGALTGLVPDRAAAQTPAGNEAGTSGGARSGTEARTAGAAASNDATLRRRIGEIFSVLPELSGIEIRVSAGTVELTGVVDDVADRKTAAQIVAQLPGVTGVRNDIRATPDTWYRTIAVYDRLEERLNDFIVFIPLLLIAVVVFILFVGASRLAVRRLSIFRRLTTNPFQQQILTQTAHVVIVVIGLVLALEILDATSLIGAVLGAAGATGIVLGFALKETIENYVAGLLLSLRQPFAPFDHIVVMDYEGHVVRLTSRATVLMTLEGNHVRIPNAVVLKNPLVNYTRNPERRFDFGVGIGVDVDLVEARALAIDIVSSMRGVLTDPEPDARIETLGDSNVVMKIFGWIDQREYALGKVRGEAIRRVKSAFEAAEYDLPEPIYRLKLMKNAGEAAVPNAKSVRPDRLSRPPGNDADVDEIDIARDDHVERQVEKERAAADQEDLLSPQAKRE